MSEKRPPIRIQFHYNVETGEFELLVDDNAPDLPEDYHDRVAQAIAGYLGQHPEIEDAGLREDLARQRPFVRRKKDEQKKKEEEDETLEE